jgi:hypothetical protein
MVPNQQPDELSSLPRAQTGPNLLATEGQFIPGPAHGRIPVSAIFVSGFGLWRNLPSWANFSDKIAAIAVRLHLKFWKSKLITIRPANL